MNQLLYDRLKDVARRRSTITYGDLAPLVDLDMGDINDRNQMAHLLEEISRHEHLNGRPLLSAVVVQGQGSESAGQPGSGFFKLARELHVMRTRNEVAFFVEELNRVHNAWA